MIMSTMKSRWRRIACSVVLLLFTASTIAGTVCTGHSASHAALAVGWVVGAAFGAAHAQHGHRHLPSTVDHHGSGAIDHPDGAPQSNGSHRGNGSDTDAACDPPVYAASTPSSDNDKHVPDASAVLPLDMLASGAIVHAWTGPAEVVCPQPPPCLAQRGLHRLLRVSPRLRL